MKISTKLNKKTKDEEKEPLQQIPYATSYAETLLHILKGYIGVGLFSMGEAFKYGGLVFAPLLIIAISITSIHCMHILIRCAREVSLRSTDSIHPPDFAETIEQCFKMGPEYASRRSLFAKTLVNFCLCFTQLGMCSIYFVFIATNLKQVMDEYIYPFDERVYMTLVLMPILLISWIRNLKYLAPFSGAANMLMVAVIAITLYFCVIDLQPLSSRNAFGTWESLPLVFGTVVLCFEGISLVLPLQNSMKHPEQFVAPFGVLNIGMIITTILFLIMGTFGYLKFGEQVQSSVTLNLPNNNIIAQSARITVAVVIVFSYALQFYVPVQIIWPSVKKIVHGENSETVEKSAVTKHNKIISEVIFRSIFVIFTYCVAVVVPELGLFISFLGALSGTSLTLIFPPLAEMFLLHSEMSWFVMAKNIVIITLGLIGCVTGTYTSATAIIDTLF